jgi:hypothetical protein
VRLHIDVVVVSIGVVGGVIALLLTLAIVYYLRNRDPKKTAFETWVDVYQGKVPTFVERYNTSRSELYALRCDLSVFIGTAYGNACDDLILPHPVVCRCWYMSDLKAAVADAENAETDDVYGDKTSDTGAAFEIGASNPMQGSGG